MADDVTRHAAAGDLPNDRARGDATPHVARLGDLHDFEVAEGYPDIRGWKVVTADGVHVGKVKDLIVDTAAMRTRYIDLELDDDVLKSRVAGRDAARRAEDREVMLPVDAAQLDDRGDVVRVPGMSVEQIVALPLYDEDAIASGAGHVAHEPMREPIPVVGRSPAIDDREVRRPVANDRDALAARVPEGADETVIERRPVVWEEIVVQRRRVTNAQDETARDETLRDDRRAP